MTFPPEDGLVELLRPHAAGRVGLAMAPEGVAGFATAFLLASRAADTLPREGRDVVAVTRRLPEVLLSGNPEIASLLVRQTVGPLLAQPAHVARDAGGDAGRAARPRRVGQARGRGALLPPQHRDLPDPARSRSWTGLRLSDPRDKLLLTLGVLAQAS